MFGSLMAVAKPGREETVKLVDYWWRIIRKWYPGMHSQVYNVPPVHFNTVSYKPKPEKAPPQDEPCAQFGMYVYKPCQYSTAKDDEAQQRTLWTISKFLGRRRSTAFVLSNMEFHNYLSKEYAVDPAVGTRVPNYPRINLRKKEEEGDWDVLVIDKREGIFVLEVKSIGDSDAVRSVSEEEKLKVGIT